MKKVFPPDWILDGELYVHGWRLQDINAAIAVNRHAPTDRSSLVEFHIFDRVSYGLPFEHRFIDMAKSIGDPGPGIKLVTTVRVSDSLTANDFYVACVRSGYEGVMYRLNDCPYTKPKQPGGRKFLSDKNNRCWHLLKRKDWQDNEFICVGVDEGIGKRLGRAGALVCETSDGKRFGVGSGLTDDEATFYLENPPIGQWIKVKYLCLTSDGIPFNPTVEAVCELTSS
jgi:DNA ligase-1